MLPWDTKKLSLLLTQLSHIIKLKLTHHNLAVTKPKSGPKVGVVGWWRWRLSWIIKLPIKFCGCYGRGSYSIQVSQTTMHGPNPDFENCRIKWNKLGLSCAKLKLTLSLMRFQNNYSSWGGGIHHIIPLGQKWKAWCHKISPLALKLVVLEPKQNLDPEHANQ